MTNDQLTIFNDEQKTRLHLEPVNPALVVIPAELSMPRLERGTREWMKSFKHINRLGLIATPRSLEVSPRKEGVFLTKPESSISKDFWMPDQVRHDGQRNL